MKCDIHSTLFCLAIFFLLMYYYGYQRRVGATLNFIHNRGSGPEGKRMYVRVDVTRAGISASNISRTALHSDDANETLARPSAGNSSDSAGVLETQNFPRGRNNAVPPGGTKEEKRPLNDPRSQKKYSTAERITEFSKPEEIHVKEIFEVHKLIESEDNVFFIETSCSIDRIGSVQGRLILKPRQACAIYSTANHNPSKHVILIVTCPLIQNFYHESPAYMRAVFDLPNFYVARVDLTEMYENSPVSVLSKGRLRQSAFPVEHNADIFRILAVYLFGGTYMDLDIVTTRPLDDLGTNYIGAEVFDSVATGVFNFKAHHPYLKKYLSEAYQAYSPREWTSIGPALATSVLIEFCNLTLQESTNLTRIGHISRCGIKVWSNEVFYPISHWNWELYMNETAWPIVQSSLKQTYAVHVWNHKSAGTPIRVGSHQPYGKLAEQNCPPVYRQCGEVF